jgi:hypothetical protein
MVFLKDLEVEYLLIFYYLLILKQYSNLTFKEAYTLKFNSMQMEHLNLHQKTKLAMKQELLFQSYFHADNKPSSLEIKENPLLIKAKYDSKNCLLIHSKLKRDYEVHIQKLKLNLHLYRFHYQKFQSLYFSNQAYNLLYNNLKYQLHKYVQYL